MAEEVRVMGRLPAVARPWLSELAGRFAVKVEATLPAGEGPLVDRIEAMLRDAARPLVEQYLREWRPEPLAVADWEPYIDRVAVALAYHWWRFLVAEDEGQRKGGP
jgi:hypothetical protein